MDKLKFILFSIVVLTLLGLLGYWSIVTIKSGSEFEITQKIQKFQKENEDLKKQVADLTDKLDSYKSKIVDVVPEVKDPEIKTVPTASKPTVVPTQNKNQSLINELQKLIDSNVSMKLKSSGTRVGIVQNFLNIYNNTSNKIDNDYGPSMETAIKAFQSDQGLTADGQAGPGTFKEMINWLKK